MKRLNAAGLSPQYIHGAGVALLLLTGVGFVHFQARPAVAARAHTRSLDEELKTRRESLQQLQSSRKDAEGRVVALRGQLADRLMHLVPKSHLNERLEQLSRLVETSGMSVERLAPVDTVTSGPFPSLQLRLVGHGPYDACERLMGTLHSTFVDIAITSLRVKATPENPAAVVNLDLELLWYTAADAPGAR